MANYTLHLGYNWNGPPVGSLWTADPSSYRFLDYALADASGAPAWFQFQEDDDLYIQLWDLSSRTSPYPSQFACNLSLGSLDAQSPGTYDPSTYLNLNNVASVESMSVDGRTNSYLQISSFQLTVSESGPYTCPWQVYRGYTIPVGPLTFTTDLVCKLSFYLKATAEHDGTRADQIFISDPETRIGSGAPRSPG